MKAGKKSKIFNCACQLFVVVLVLVWLLAIAKIFIIDAQQIVVSYDTVDKQTNSRHVKVALINPVNPLADIEIDIALSNKNIANVVPALETKKIPRFSEWSQYQQLPHKELLGVRSADAPSPPLVLPPAAPVVLQPPVEKHSYKIVDIPNPPILSRTDPVPVPGPGSKLDPTDLQWPPIQVDQVTIPDIEGYDVMPLTEMKVPRFWAPKLDPNNPNKGMMELGSFVNEKPTIYLMIASYRDFQCRETITSAFMRADHPERLFVGAVDQVVPGDAGCVDLEIPCSQDPTQMICKYKDQISVYKMDAQYATGPVAARHIGDRMYRGQYFVMQMDAHCLFINHWDTKITTQWYNTHNEMAVLSSYLTDVQGSISPRGDSLRQTRPIMCNSDFEGLMPARYLRHGSQPEDYAAISDMPQLQPFWAAGFSFSRGHFKVQVPYDGFQPMVFQGEEIAIGIRGFTFGYDFYAPKDSVVFHEYAERSNRRKKIHMFWENSEKHKGEGQKSLKRAMAIIGMSPDVDPASWDHSESDKYGLGTVRPVQQFYELFLINPQARKAVQLCPFVNSGIMHRTFQPFLQQNGQGIDYSNPLMSQFDTLTVLNQRLKQIGKPVVESPF